MWTYIKEYLSACFAHVETVEPALAVDDGQQSANAALLDLVDFAMAHPVQILSSGTRRVLFEVLPLGPPELEQRLRTWLSTHDERCRDCLSVLNAHLRSPPNVMAAVAPQIASAATSRDLDIRMLAREIGDKTHLFAPPTLIRDPSLLARYRTRPLIDARPRLSDRPRISSTRPLEDTFDPRELVRPFLQESVAIAGAARIPGEFVLQRAYELMRAIADEAIWNEDGENDLREHLDKMELNFTFRRPRAQVARQALLQVAGELIDAGSISDRSATELYSMLRTSDPGMEGKLPSVRPAGVPAPEWPESRSKRETWLESSSAREQVRFALSDGDWVIVAESSDWKCSTSLESRQSLVHVAGSDRNEEVAPERLFARRVKELRGDYFRLVEIAEDECAIENLHIDLDSPGGDWLAFNPVLARRLGWLPAPDGMFSWLREGEIVAKSVWWMDGHPHFSHRFHDECAVGMGWLVVVTRSAMNQLVSALGVLMRTFVLTRRCQQQSGEEVARTVSWTEALT